MENHNVSVLPHGSLVREPLQSVWWNHINQQQTWRKNWTQDKLFVIHLRQKKINYKVKKSRYFLRKKKSKVANIVVFVTNVVPLVRDLACQQTLQQRQTSWGTFSECSLAALLTDMMVHFSSFFSDTLGVTAWREGKMTHQFQSSSGCWWEDVFSNKRLTQANRG